jgi:hypothetical protein
MVAMEAGTMAQEAFQVNKDRLPAKFHYTTDRESFQRSQRLQFALGKLRGDDDNENQDPAPIIPLQTSTRTAVPVPSDLRGESTYPSKQAAMTKAGGTTADRLHAEESRGTLHEEIEKDRRNDQARDLISTATSKSNTIEISVKSCLKDPNDSSHKDIRNTMQPVCAGDDARDGVGQKKVKLLLNFDDDSMDSEGAPSSKNGKAPCDMSSKLSAKASNSSEESDKDASTYNAFTDSSYESDSSLEGYSTESSTKVKKTWRTDTNEDEQHPQGKPIKLYTDLLNNLGRESQHSLDTISCPCIVISPIEQASDFLHQLVNNFNFELFVVPDRIRDHAKSQPIKADITEDLSLNLSEVSESSDEEAARIIKIKTNQPGPFKLATTLPRRDFMARLREQHANRSAKAAAAEVKMEDPNREVEEKSPNVRRRKLMFQVVQETDAAVETIPHVISTDTLSTRSTVPRDAKCDLFMGCFQEKHRIKPPPLRLNWKHDDLISLEDAIKVVSKPDKRNTKGRIAAWNLPTVVNSFGQEVIDLATSGDFELRSTSDNDSDEEENNYGEGENDDDSDAESMVPVKHGKREKVEPSRMDTRERSTADCESALDRNDESSDLIMVGSDIAVKTAGIPRGLRNTTEEGEESKAKSRSDHSQVIPQFNEAHQKELKSKIEEFRQRKQGMPATPISLVGSSSAGANQPMPVSLPKASKKVAQAYIDALIKKYVDESGEGPGEIVVEPREPQESPQPKNAVITSNSGMTLDPAQHTVSGPRQDPGGSTSARHVVKSQTELEGLGSDVRHAAKSQAELNRMSSLNTTTKTPEEPFDLDVFVSRIDSVVNHLVSSGKLSQQSGQSFGSDVEQRTLGDISAELIQNLAILRARQTAGGTITRTKSTSTGMSFGTSTSDKPSGAVPDAVMPIDMPSIVSDTKSGRQSGRSIQELRGKRDRAAIAVREGAKRLMGWSMDTTEESSRREGIRNWDQSRSSRSQSEPPALKISYEPPVESNEVPLLSHEQRDDVHEVLEESFGEPTRSALAAQEQVHELFPVPMQLGFSMIRAQGGRDNYSVDPSGCYTESDFEVSTLGTENFLHNDLSTMGEDSAADEEKQFARIESMIRGLQANRQSSNSAYYY